MYLLRRSTSVPIADFSKPMIKSPSQPSASPAPTPERSPKRSAAFKPAAAGDCDVNLAIESAVQLFLERLAVAAPVTSAEESHLCLASPSNVSCMYSSACRASRSAPGV